MSSRNNPNRIKMHRSYTVIDISEKTYTSTVRRTEDKLKDKIEGKDVEIFPNEAYFLIDKKGKGSYPQGSIVSFNIYEKRLDGEPILNTMNSSILYNKENH